MSHQSTSDSNDDTLHAPESLDEKPEQMSQELPDGGIKWNLVSASGRAVRYVPLSRNSQLLLMKKNVMRHKWNDACDLIQMLLTDARHPPLVVFKYGMLILMNYAPKQRDDFKEWYADYMWPFVSRFLSYSRREKNKIARAILMGINKKEIVLDVSGILFQYRMDEEIDDLFLELSGEQSVNRRVSEYYDRKFKNRVIEKYYKGYQAYMSFIKWRRQNTDDKHISEDDEEDDEDNEVNRSRFEFNEQEFSIVSQFQSVLESSENLNVDVFLSSLLQMLERKRKFREAVEFTEKHCERHKNDLHAFLRHYDMIRKRVDQIRGKDNNAAELQILEEMRIDSFENIVRLSPDHQIIRDVCDSEESIGNDSTNHSDLSDRLKLLMNYLDYRNNMHDVIAWQSFRALIEELEQTSRDQFREFVTFFTARYHDYWKCVHFNIKQISSEDDLVIESKCAVLDMMGRSKDGYKQAVESYRVADQ